MFGWLITSHRNSQVRNSTLQASEFEIWRLQLLRQLLSSNVTMHSGVEHCTEVLVAMLEVIHMPCAFGLLCELPPGLTAPLWKTWSSRLGEDGTWPNWTSWIPITSSPSIIILMDVGFMTCAACLSSSGSRLTTHVREVQLCVCFLTFTHDVQFVAHTRSCTSFSSTVKCVMFVVCESETSENENVFVPLHQKLFNYTVE